MTEVPGSIAVNILLLVGAGLILSLGVPLLFARLVLRPGLAVIDILYRWWQPIGRRLRLRTLSARRERLMAKHEYIGDRLRRTEANLDFEAPFSRENSEE